MFDSQSKWSKRVNFHCLCLRSLRIAVVRWLWACGKHFWSSLGNIVTILILSLVTMMSKYKWCAIVKIVKNGQLMFLCSHFSPPHLFRSYSPNHQSCAMRSTTGKTLDAARNVNQVYTHTHTNTQLICRIENKNNFSIHKDAKSKEEGCVCLK